jgi:hypothetical protein
MQAHPTWVGFFIALAVLVGLGVELAILSRMYILVEARQRVRKQHSDSSAVRAADH